MINKPEQHAKSRMKHGTTGKPVNWPKLNAGQGAHLTTRNGDVVKFIRLPYAARSKYTPGPKPVRVTTQEGVT